MHPFVVVLVEPALVVVMELLCEQHTPGVVVEWFLLVVEEEAS